MKGKFTAWDRTKHKWLNIHHICVDFKGECVFVDAYGKLGEDLVCYSLLPDSKNVDLYMNGELWG